MAAALAILAFGPEIRGQQPGPLATETEPGVFTASVGFGVNAQAGSESDGGDGQVVDVPDGGATLLIAADIGTSYSIRFGSGGEWESWQSVTAAAEEGPDGPLSESEVAVVEKIAIGPFLIEPDYDQVELVALSHPDAQVDLVFLTDDRTATNRGSPADQGLRLTLPRVAGARQTLDSTRPTIQPRSAWADHGWSYTTSGCENGPRRSSNIQAMVIHHTVTGNTYSQADVDDLLRAIYHAHVNINGWCDVGYNFLVDRFGTIWEGRSGGVDAPIIGGHAKGFNTSTVGVAMLGQHHPSAQPAATRPSDATEEAIERLATWKLGLHGVDPSGTTWLQNRSTSGAQKLTGGQWHLVSTIMGHRDVGLTSCPGDYGIEVAHGLVGPLSGALSSAAESPAAQWAPSQHGEGVITVDTSGGLRPGGAVGLPGLGLTSAAWTRPTIPTGRSVVAVEAVSLGTSAAGYVLDNQGELHPFGGAPSVGRGSWGDQTVVGMGLLMADSPTPPSAGGWVVTAPGKVIGFGSASDKAVSSGGTVIAAALGPRGDGYLLESDGGLRAVGSAPAVSLQWSAGVEPVDIALHPTQGGWVLGSNGVIRGFGGPADQTLSGALEPAVTRPVAIIAGSEAGGWVVTSDGQLRPFGGAEPILPLKTVATKPNVVNASLVAAGTAGPDHQSNDARFVKAVMRIFLDQDVADDDPDYLYWLARVQSGASRTQITGPLAQSPEWAGVRVDQMYRDVLGREADPSGRTYWLDQLARGLRLQDLGVYFYGSQEYFTSKGTPTRFVESLYQVLLGRQPDTGGLNYWVSQLKRGAGADVIADGFYSSIESRRKRVTTLYREVLGREPDPQGREYWANNLLVADDVSLAANLAASDEFYLNSGR